MKAEMAQKDNHKTYTGKDGFIHPNEAPPRIKYSSTFMTEAIIMVGGNRIQSVERPTSIYRLLHNFSLTVSGTHSIVFSGLGAGRHERYTI